uniref:Uncharacterized protein n=1 Tax=Pararge aegeria TaxID=116150 RepID=S4P707_9NEOP
MVILFKTICCNSQCNKCYREVVAQTYTVCYTEIRHVTGNHRCSVPWLMGIVDCYNWRPRASHKQISGLCKNICNLRLVCPMKATGNQWTKSHWFNEN